MVFAFIGSSCAILACINLTSQKAIKLFDDKALENDISAELSEHYKKEYNASGIPPEVYTESIDSDYIRKSGHTCIEKAFEVLENSGTYSAMPPENAALESSIDSFFNDYADKSGYKKDENFENKLASTKKAAYETISSYSDVFKFSTINNKGFLSKASKVYSNRFALSAATIIATFFLMLLLLIVNHKKKITFLYWTGISAIIAGISGGGLSIYLLAGNYFDSFSIKQPAVFNAYTGTMYKLTEAFMAVEIAVTVIGICMLVIYGLFHEKNKKNNVN